MHTVLSAFMRLKAPQPLLSVLSMSPLKERYHLLEHVGEGSFSMVYEAKDIQTNQRGED